MNWDIIGMIIVFLIGTVLLVYGLRYNRASKNNNSLGFLPDIGDSSIWGFILSLLFGILFLVIWEKMPWWLNKILIFLFGFGIFMIGIVILQGKI